MDFAYTAEDDAFRDDLRGWLDENLTKFFAEYGEESTDPGVSGIMGAMERRRSWQRRLNEGRWAAITWPEEWGGRDATVMQNVIYSEEMARYKTPGIFNANGLWQIGPMIIRWGTDEQKERWLPGILSADQHWCQGFSEPEAGSDLANLRTLAVRDDDAGVYVVNGQKIWISSAHVAEWGLFLVRTDPTAIERGIKHEGITALIVDMNTPGIECRPIRDIVGDEMFNEVFFTDARIPISDRLGDEGAGWQVAMGTLGHERVGTAGLAIGMKSDLDSMVSATRAENPTALDDPDLRDRIARAYTHIEFTRLLNYRALSKVLKGEKTWPEVQIAKLQWSYLAQTLAELAVDLLGPAGLLGKGGPDAVDEGKWSRLYVFQRYTSIGAGTTEVQKNVIADRAIGMPRR
ncbi:MAG TPA: acyl-CoA dehydrogenase family protein [Acidimicrobiales bacterium]|nr:acyl-CoA dehydrogenase family protein [Acidimicrobiales bacterium]